MAPLIVLLGVFGLAFGIERRRGQEDAMNRAGFIALGVMFIFTGVSHFIMSAQMVEMLPQFVPNRTLVIWVTGVLEVCGGVGLLVARTRRITACCLFAFLVGVFPANVYSALNGVGVGGNAGGPEYLYFRVPLQLLFLAWTYWFGIRNSRPDAVLGS